MFTAFETIDSCLAVPAAFRVALWAMLAGAVSMWLYRLISPQSRLSGLATEMQTAQRQLSEYDGEFAGLWPLISRSLRLSARRVGLSIGPSLLAAAPIILLLLCLNHQYPSAGQTPPLAAATQSHPTVEVERAEAAVTTVDSVILASATSDDPVDQARSKSLDFLRFGPAWMRTWLFLFIAASSLSALAVRQLGGII